LLFAYFKNFYYCPIRLGLIYFIYIILAKSKIKPQTNFNKANPIGQEAFYLKEKISCEKLA